MTRDQPKSGTDAGARPRVVRVVHPDLFGRQRAKQIPIGVAERAATIAYSKMSLAEDLMGVPVDESAFPAVAGHPDLDARLEPATSLTPPWEPDARWMLSSLEEHGAPSPLCVRSALRNARDRLAERGWHAVAAGEPEFYLFEGGEQPRPYGGAGVSYTMDRIADPTGAAGRIHRALIDFGIGVTAINREFSRGQFEINLHHAEVLDAADRVFLLKTGLKELAIIEGLRASFMPKPLSGEEGSSLHVHMSFWDGDRNVFAEGADGISELAMSAIAGIQDHAPAIHAFAAPTINSYKRLRGEGLSPRSSGWAADNRYSYLRLPAERGDATRFELRAGDSSASPHLLMAAMIHAALDGIERGLTPHAEGRPLPQSLSASIAALEQDAVLRTALGDELVDVYAAVKRAESADFDAAVTDWEWRLYADSV